jgi:hypothetical protein
MIIHYDPDATVVETTHTTCSYHKQNPGKPFAGCTCSSSYSHRKATPQEYSENRKRRLEQRRVELVSELEVINRELR